MSNVVFDGKLIRKVRFTSAFRESLQQTPPGSVIIFTGPERDAVSAACTLLVGLRDRSRYYDVDTITAGLLSWGKQDGEALSSFRYSMEVLPLVGIGYVDNFFLKALERADRFSAWLRQIMKKRITRGQTTVIASPKLAKDMMFYWFELAEQSGVIARIEDVLEEHEGGKIKKAVKQKLGSGSSSFHQKPERGVSRVRDRADSEDRGKRSCGKPRKGDPFTMG